MRVVVPVAARGQRQPRHASRGRLLDDDRRAAQRRSRCRGQPRIAAGGRRVGDADRDRRQVARVGREHGQRPEDDVGGVLDVGQPLAEAAQQLDPAAVDDLLGRLGRDVHAPLDRAVGGEDRGVGEREVALLQEAAPRQRDGLVLDPGRAVPGEDRGHHRPDHVPGLGEHLARRRAQRRRMLAPDERRVGLVVDQHELRAPEQGDGKPRVQREADGVAQRQRPEPDRAQWRRRPVDGCVGAAQRARGVEEGFPAHLAPA